MDFNAFVKCFDTGQPAQSAQGDLDPNVLPLVNLLHVRGHNTS